MTKSKSNSKNVSKTIRHGQIVHTRDDFFQGSDGKSSKSRMAVVVETNRKNEMALVKLTHSTKNSTKSISGYRDGTSRYSTHDVYTKDNKGQPISSSTSTRSGKKKFILERKKTKDVPKSQVNVIKKDVVKDPKFGKRNRKRLRFLKGR